MEAIFKRTGGADFPDRLKVMISGSPKAGKTTLLGTVPNIVVADTEPWANNLQSIAHCNVPYTTIEGTSDLQRLRFVLNDATLRAKAAEQMGLPAIEAVAIDTLDTLQQILKAERLRDTRQSQFLRDDWAWLKDEMTQIVRAFTALPLHVFFVVHTKTAEIGRGDDSRTVVLPGLQGAIAEEIAGMVGYSLYAFRKQEIRPDGSPYTKYWLRTEGDETYGYVGNRAAGRLPDVIEPNFKAIYDAAMMSRPAPAPAPTPVSVPDETPGAAAAPAATAQTTPAQVGQFSAQQSEPVASPPPGDDELVNATALTHIRKVYDAIGLSFPEEKIRALTLRDARGIVRMWGACQRDEIEGRGGGGVAQEMTTYLRDLGCLDPQDEARLAAQEPTSTDEAPGASAQEPAPDAPGPDSAPDEQVPTPVEPVKPVVVADPNGTIEQVLAYVDEGPRERVQEVYDAETAKPRPRQTLLNHLAGRGAVPTTPPSLQEPAPEFPPAPDTTPTPVTAADEQAVSVAEAALGAQLIGEQADDGSPAPCEECGQPVDDEDIAVLSRTRFKRWLCVAHYIAQTKKPVPA